MNHLRAQIWTQSIKLLHLDLADRHICHRKRCIQDRSSESTQVLEWSTSRHQRWNRKFK